MTRDEAASILRGVVNGSSTRRAKLSDAVETLAKLPDLMGATEAAAELGVTTSNLAKIANMPEPLYTLRAGRFYNADEVRALARERKG